MGQLTHPLPHSPPLQWVGGVPCAQSDGHVAVVTDACKLPVAVSSSVLKCRLDFEKLG